MTTPPLRPGLLPAFHELGADTFEDLCREILQQEPNVDNVEPFGTRGQRQFGVDLLIEFTDGSIWAAQCKSHQHCNARLIRNACDNFLHHADRWASKGVAKFLLLLAADTRRTQLHDERIRQRRHLSARGFAFSVWSAAALKFKLRPHPRLVDHFFPYNVAFICGPSAVLSLHPPAQDLTFLNLTKQYAERVDADYANIKSLWRDGHPRKALSKLRTITAEATTWSVLPAQTQARLRHLEGRILVALEQVAAAQAILSTPNPHDVSGRARLEAMIASARGRLQDAIAAVAADPDPDNQALHAALHFQAGRPDLALPILAALPDHSEARRLQAIISLASGDMSNAKIEAERALALTPTSYWARYTAAIIRYLAALSPAIAPRGLPEWPPPLPPALIRQDREAVTARNTAADEFHSLSDSQFHHSHRELACLHAWHLACLADNPDRRQTATRVAQASLTRAPDNYRVMAWILARDLPVAVDATMNALDVKIRNQHADPEEVIGLVAANAALGNISQARDLLDKTADIFLNQPEQALVTSWHRRLADRHTNSQANRGHLENATDKALERLAEATARRDHMTCWEQYMTLAQSGRWQEIAATSHAIVSLFQTPDAVRLAAHALYNTRDVTGCLELLARGTTLFLDGQLPSDLRRLQVRAQSDAGDLPDAILAATQDFHATRTRDAFLELARLYFQIGDLKRLAILAREHHTVPGLLAPDFLTLVSYLKIEDPQLARTLLKRASATGIADEHAATAFELASSVGASPEQHELASRIASLASTGSAGIRSLDLKQLLTHIKERHQQLAQIESSLRQGSIPLHLVSQAANVPLARMLRTARLLSTAVPSSTSPGPIFQRFGGRTDALSPNTFSPDCRLHVDVTALLNAAHLGVLEPIEAEFRPLQIAQDTVVALAAMQDSLRSTQPDRVANQRHLLDLASTGPVTPVAVQTSVPRPQIEVNVADYVLRLLHYAASTGCLLLDFLPLPSTDPSVSVTSLPALYSRLLRTPHCVVDALRHCRRLSPADHRRAMSALGAVTVAPEHADIVARTRLICGNEVLLLLASAGVLDIAADTFDIVVPKDAVDRLRYDLAAVDQDEEDAQWIGSIVDRIRAGVDTGTYEFLPRRSPPAEPTPGGPLSELEVVLQDVLAIRGKPSDLLWIDDRCINSHRHSEGKNIVDTVDLIRCLYARHRISENELFRLLTHLRASDSRFIAFQAEELLSALRDAPVRDGVLVETETLRILRQYYARCLLDADVLRPPTEADAAVASHGEWQFLLTCGNAVLNAIVLLWKTNSTEDAFAKAEWLLRNMYVEDRGLYATTMPQTGESDVYRSALSVAALVGWTLELDDVNAGRGVRRKYMAWLHRRVLQARFAVDKTFTDMTVERIKDTITGQILDENAQRRELALRLLGRLWADLPEPLRRLTEADQEFLERLRVKTTTVVEVGVLKLDSRQLWMTVAKVLNGGDPATIETVDGKVVDIVPHSVEPASFRIRCAQLAIDERVHHEDLAFLSDSLRVRDAAARKLKSYFDMLPNRREAAIAAVVAGQDPGARMHAAVAARAASGALFYMDLAAALQPGAEFRPADALPADRQILIEHLRMDAGADARDRWESAVQGLLLEYGVVEVATRIAGLPVPWPDVFVDAVASLSSDQRRATIREIVRRLGKSPVGMVQSFDLLMRIVQGAGRRGRIARRFIAALLDEGHRPTFDAWHAVLCWTHEQLGLDREIRGGPLDLRLVLVWTHADRIFRVLMERGVSAEWVSRVFGAAQRLLRAEFVFPESACTGDVASPQFVDAETLALAGLGSICIDHGLGAVGMTLLPEKFVGATEAVQGATVSTLISDGSCVTNVLGTWLSRWRDALCCLPESMHSQLLVRSNRAAAIELCASIEVGEAGKGDEPGWHQLMTRIGSRPLRDDVRRAFERCLGGTDFVNMSRRDPQLATLVLHFVGMHAGNLGDDCREAMREAVIRLACELRDLKMSEEMELALGQALVKALIGCTWTRSGADAEQGARALSAALGRVIDSVPLGSFAVGGASLVMAFCEELPASQARHFWRIRERLRLRGRL